MKTRRSYWRSAADIPNTPGFTLTVMNDAGEIAPAIVTRSQIDGCHYLHHAETGERIPCRLISGWEPR